MSQWSKILEKSHLSLSIVLVYVIDLELHYKEAEENEEESF